MLNKKTTKKNNTKIWKVKEWIGTCGRKDATIQELYHDSWKKRCKNTGVNKWNTHVLVVRKDKKKEKKIKAMKNNGWHKKLFRWHYKIQLWRIMDDIKKKIVFSNDTSKFSN